MSNWKIIWKNGLIGRKTKKGGITVAMLKITGVTKHFPNCGHITCELRTHAQDNVTDKNTTSKDNVYLSVQVEEV